MAGVLSGRRRYLTIRLWCATNAGHLPACFDVDLSLVSGQTSSVLSYIKGDETVDISGRGAVYKGATCPGFTCGLRSRNNRVMFLSVGPQKRKAETRTGSHVQQTSKSNSRALREPADFKSRMLDSARDRISGRNQSREVSPRFRTAETN